MDDAGDIIFFVYEAVVTGFGLLILWIILSPVILILYDFITSIFKGESQPSNDGVATGESGASSGERVVSRPGDVTELTGGEDLDTWKNRLRIIWSGNGPEVMFAYTKADGTSSGCRRRVHLRALVTHPETGLYLRGERPKSDNESYFKVSRINTSIALDGRKIPVEEFLGMLREGKFEAHSEPKPRPTADKPPAKPKPKSKPGKPELPRIDTRAERAKATMELDAAGWRKEGILSLSGYRVGRARGRPANIRQKILNTILLYDDLSDVPDRAYAAEWGKPASRQRYKKMHDSIETFLNNGRKRHGPKDMSKAIGDWQSDLQYLEGKLRKYL